MYRSILGFVFFVCVTTVAVSLPASFARAEVAAIEDATRDMSIGKTDAPVTMIEYASLGCPHCANFHENTFPKIKENYIDTGKVRMIYRDYPLGTPALAASMISRCAGSQRYFGMVDLFFRSQKQWGQADNPLEALKKTARFGGMSGPDVDACLQNQDLLTFIRDTAAKGQKEFNVSATPTFIIGDVTIPGNLPYDDFKGYLDKALDKAR